jgi:hypothetical protein
MVSELDEVLEMTDEIRIGFKIKNNMKLNDTKNNKNETYLNLDKHSYNINKLDKDIDKIKNNLHTLNNTINDMKIKSKNNTENSLIKNISKFHNNETS